MTGTINPIELLTNNELVVKDAIKLESSSVSNIVDPVFKRIAELKSEKANGVLYHNVSLSLINTLMINNKLKSIKTDFDADNSTVIKFDRFNSIFKKVVLRAFLTDQNDFWNEQIKNKEFKLDFYLKKKFIREHCIKHSFPSIAKLALGILSFEVMDYTCKLFKRDNKVSYDKLEVSNLVQEFSTFYNNTEYNKIQNISNTVRKNEFLDAVEKHKVSIFTLIDEFCDSLSQLLDGLGQETNFELKIEIINTLLDIQNMKRATAVDGKLDTKTVDGALETIIGDERRKLTNIEISEILPDIDEIVAKFSKK